jgi:hypothetical protein
LKLLSSTRGKAITVVVLVLALFLMRPGAQRLKSRIVRSISLALGRQVDVGSVSLRVLPPSFDLENFVIHDDPGFSAEPLLRSQDVTAVLRLSSLLRGRLEVAHLSLTEPSLNLVRNSEGHWNIENLVLRAARVPVAPTAKSRTENRPAFPYIEAVRSRINVKFGTEKKPYALTDAEFALWQDSENTWGMRLKAQPMRTDLNLTDIGMLEVKGSWQRASSLREMPLQFSLQWDRAQLGQVTKLVYGNDKGWRGSVRLAATLSGSPARLTLDTDASIQDFRRYDIAEGGALRLAARCSARYSSVDYVISKLACQAPVGDGQVLLGGNVAARLGAPSYHLALVARDVPMQSLVELARHAKKNIPNDLLTAGKLDANIKFSREYGAAAIWEGGGETAGFRLASKVTKTELILNRIPFAISQTRDLKQIEKKHRVQASRVPDYPGVEQALSQPYLDVGPFAVALGASSPVTLHGQVARSGYNLSIQGDAQVQRVLHAARTVGLSASPLTADGLAKVDLQLGGVWSGFTAPKAVGTAQLRSIRAEARGLNSPLEIASANLLLNNDDIGVHNIVAIVGGSRWHGSIVLPRQCAVPGTCPVRFDLHADEIATDALNELLSPHARQRPWYRFLSSSAQSGSPFLASLRAIGRLSANRVLIHKLAATRVSANVELRDGRLVLADLRGDLMGGKHLGEWKADFNAKPPEYRGSGTLERVSLGQLAEFMRDGWITGSATATYHATLSGLSLPELLSSASASLQADAHDGSLPHVTLAAGNGPLYMRRFVGHLLLSEGKFKVEEGKLETAGSIYQVSGTASLDRILDLKLARDGAPGFTVTGTLTEPHVSVSLPPEMQAALKP